MSGVEWFAAICVALTLIAICAVIVGELIDD